MMQPDQDWLVNIVQLGKITGHDRRNLPEYDMHTFEECRLDLEPVYQGSGNDRQLIANGVLFLYSEFTTPFPKLDPSWLKGKMIDEDGNEYVITKIVPIQSVTSTKLYGYELEVI